MYIYVYIYIYIYIYVYIMYIYIYIFCKSYETDKQISLYLNFFLIILLRIAKNLCLIFTDGFGMNSVGVCEEKSSFNINIKQRKKFKLN